MWRDIASVNLRSFNFLVLMCCILIVPKETLRSVIFSDTAMDLYYIIVGDIPTATFEASHLFTKTK